MGGALEFDSLQGTIMLKGVPGTATEPGNPENEHTSVHP